MALNITTPVTTLDGIELATSYARIEVRDGVTGTQLITGIEIYASQAAFEAGRGALTIEDPSMVDVTLPLRTYIVSEYDRTVDGGDILALAHTYAQAALAEKGITSTIILD